jgi:hypothetical protein
MTGMNTDLTAKIDADVGNATVAANEYTDAAVLVLDGSMTKTITNTVDELNTKAATAANTAAQKAAETEDALEAAVENANRAITEAGVETDRKLALVGTSLTALETKIKADIDDGLKKELAVLKNGLSGTSTAFFATTCNDVLKARPNALNGEYYVKSTISAPAVPVYCEKVGKNFVNQVR